MDIAYKIARRSSWMGQMRLWGKYHGEFDEVSMFNGKTPIHLSYKHQVSIVAANKFSGQKRLVLACVDLNLVHGHIETKLNLSAKEGSMFVDDFPHLYGNIPLDAVIWVDNLKWQDGKFTFPKQFTL